MPNPFWTMADAALVEARKDAEDLRDKALIDKMFSFKETARHPVYGPYGYAGSDGRSRVDKNTHDAVMMAHYLAGQPFVITQGGLNNKGVAASASTHNGLGVLDTKTSGVGMTLEEAKKVVAFGLECGVHGMIRGVPGYDRMSPHIHWVRLGARSVMHSSAYNSVYDKRYGTLYGGGGLQGAPWTRWYGPKMIKAVTWENSKYNPKNGWKP